MVGDVETIDESIADLEENLQVLKTMEEINNYFSLKLRFSMDEKRAQLRQSHIIESLDNKFGTQVKKVQSHKTPGMTKFLFVRSMNDSEKIFAEDQIKVLVHMWDVIVPCEARQS